ncbi:MAG: hypothetical protein K6B28_01760 [Lachnospiraceae bacterium]|nr:hypothetical protein [Lachnospiraceae bacterium]
MSVSQDIRREQKEYMSRMTTKEKIIYLAGYYKWYVIGIAVFLFFLITIIRDVNENKKPVYLNVVMANTDLIYDQSDSSISDDFIKYASIDTDTFQVSFDTSLSFNDNAMDSMTLSASEKMMVLYAAKQVDVLLAPESVIDRYKIGQAYLDPFEVLSEDEMKTLKEKGFEPVYCKYSETFNEDEWDAETMEDKDICIGIDVSDSTYLNGLGERGAFSDKTEPVIFTFSTVATEEGIAHAKEFLWMITSMD